MVQMHMCPSADGTDGRQPVQLVDLQDLYKPPLLPLLTIYVVVRTILRGLQQDLRELRSAGSDTSIIAIFSNLRVEIGVPSETTNTKNHLFDNSQ